jgi:hypothetical protein
MYYIIESIINCLFRYRSFYPVILLIFPLLCQGNPKFTGNY